MTNAKNTKRALLTSVMALILCMSMLVGTTFAWFTDEVTSTNNIIQTGTLDAEMYYGDTADAINNDASQGKIFDYDLWEPGFTEVKFVKIVNNGNLAFKFRLNIVSNVQTTGEYNLANVIEVRMIPVDEAKDKTREQLLQYQPVGTLSELMIDSDGAAYGYLLPAEGAANVNKAELENAPRGEIAYCIVLHMPGEKVDNNYQDLTVGDGFSVQLLATQYTWENDSFDHTYDEGAEYDEAPKANVTIATPTNVSATWGMGGAEIAGGLDLNAKFVFKTTETYEQAQESPYRYYHADFVVKADGDIPSMEAALAGYYEAYCKDYNNNRWVALASDETIKADTELRLLYLMLNGGSMNYEELCNYVPVFECGVADLSNGALDGVTLTVELRLYETTADPNSTSGNKNIETGKYITIGTYSYTFGE